MRCCLDNEELLASSGIRAEGDHKLSSKKDAVKVPTASTWIGLHEIQNIQQRQLKRSLQRQRCCCQRRLQVQPLEDPPCKRVLQVSQQIPGGASLSGRDRIHDACEILDPEGLCEPAVKP